MAENNSFRPGGATNNVQNKPSSADAGRRDEYKGNYKDRCDGVSEAEKFGTNDNPVKHDPLPAKGLGSAGG